MTQQTIDAHNDPEMFHRITTNVMQPILSDIETGSSNPAGFWNIFNRFTSHNFTPSEISSILTPYRSQIINYLNKHWTNGQKYRETYDLLYLIETIYLFKRDADIEWPEFIQLLNRLKLIVIKILLEHIRDDEIQRAITNTNNLLYLGINWPELITISKSLAHDEAPRKINESTSMDRYRNTHVARELNNLDDMLQATCSEEVDQAYQIELKLEIPWCLAMLGLASADVPNRIFMIQPFKSTIIKLMLMTIKNPETFEESNLNTRIGLAAMVKGVKRLGAKWPELDVIEKSLKFDRENSPPEIDEDVNSESIKQSEIKILKDILLDAMVEVSYKRIDKGLSKSITSKIIAMDYKSPEFNKLMEKYKPEILDNFYRMIADVYYLTNRLSRMLILKKFGYNWPEFKFIIDKSKTYIIKFMLKDITNSVNSPMVNETRFINAIYIMNHLKDLGIHWPELDIIEKSLSHDMEHMKIDEVEDIIPK